MHGLKLRGRFGVVALAAAVLVAGTVAGGAGAPPVAGAERSPSVDSAVQANAALFDPGYLISDALFFDGYAMNSVEIQSFLAARVPHCQSAYACLTTYSQSTPTMPADARCSRYVGAADESAALIISKVGRACGISQRVLLVLLEKEQSLVSMSAPTRTRFDHATGMGCPDTAPCDPRFSGFFYQVYYAARQYKIYTENPTAWNHVAGRVNQILYHPNAACGRKSVYIVNQATAGLYNYTPYTPNAASLSNLYGTGDSCSSYGNRNFWRIYSDWFGSPTDGDNLVRTVDNATVYLLAGDAKYVVSSLGTLRAYGRLGSVGFVSQSLLDQFPTAGVASTIVRTHGGTIGLLDEGQLRPFNTCTTVEHFGGSCSPDGYTQLTPFQSDRFSIGTAMTNYVTTDDGARYHVYEGARAEILDDASLAQSPWAGTFVQVAADSLAPLPYDAPIVRDSVYVEERGGSRTVFLAGGRAHDVDAASRTALGTADRSAGSLRSQSIEALPVGGPFTGVVTTEGGGVLVLSKSGSVGWPADVPLQPPAAPVLVSADLIAAYPAAAGAIGTGVFLRGSASGTAYLVGSESVRPISYSRAVESVNVDGGPIFEIPDAVLSSLPQGPTIRRIGAVVKETGSATLYLIDGLDRRVKIPSATLATATGLWGYSIQSPSAFSGYPISGALDYGVSCGEKRFFAAGGSWHEIPHELHALYPINLTELSPLTCLQFTLGADASTLIRAGSAQIYVLEDGLKRPVAALSTYQRLVAEGAYFIDVTPALANQIPTGPSY